MSNSKSVPLDPLHCCSYSSPALIKHKNHPWISTKKLLFMTARIKKEEYSAISLILKAALSLTVTDIVSLVLVCDWSIEQRRRQQSFSWKSTRELIITIQFHLDLKQQTVGQSHFTFWGMELESMLLFLIVSSPLARWALSNQQHLFSYHQERSHCATSDAFFRPLGALMHMFPPGTVRGKHSSRGHFEIHFSLKHKT